MPVRMQCTFLFLLPSCHAGTKCLLPLASAGREGYTGLMYGMFLPSFSHGYEPQTVPAHRTTALLSCHTRFHVEDGRVSAKCQSQSRDANDLFLSFCMRLMTIGNSVSELPEVSGKGGGTALHFTLLTVLLICQQQMALLLQIARKLVYCKSERPGGRRRKGQICHKLPIYKTQCSLNTRLGSTASSRHQGWEGI